MQVSYKKRIIDPKAKEVTASLFSKHLMHIYIGFKIVIRTRKSNKFAKKLDEQTPVNCKKNSPCQRRDGCLFIELLSKFVLFSSTKFDFECQMNVHRMVGKQTGDDFRKLITVEDENGESLLLIDLEPP